MNDGLVYPLASGESITIDARGTPCLTIITGAGATATVSRVNKRVGGVVVADAAHQFTVAASTRVVTEVDWPYYLVSVAGGSCEVAAP